MLRRHTSRSVSETFTQKGKLTLYAGIFTAVGCALFYSTNISDG